MIQQIKQKLDNEKVVSVRFRYNGVMREVDNITLQHGDQIVCGFETRTNGGQFSYKVKRFDVNKIEGDVMFIDPPKREGPVIGRV